MQRVRFAGALALLGLSGTGCGSRTPLGLQTRAGQDDADGGAGAIGAAGEPFGVDPPDVRLGGDASDGSFGPGSCSDDSGHLYPNGTSWLLPDCPIGTCWCVYGVLECAEACEVVYKAPDAAPPPPPCLDDGVVHAEGERWSCSDGCNTCWCIGQQLVTTTIACTTTSDAATNNPADWTCNDWNGTPHKAGPHHDYGSSSPIRFPCGDGRTACTCCRNGITCTTTNP